MIIHLSGGGFIIHNLIQQPIVAGFKNETDNMKKMLSDMISKETDTTKKLSQILCIVNLT